MKQPIPNSLTMKHLALFCLLSAHFIIFGAEKKEEQPTKPETILLAELDQLKKLIDYFESQEAQKSEKQRLSLGKSLLQYPTVNLLKPLEITIKKGTIQLKSIETEGIGYTIAKHYAFVTGSKQYMESGMPWERKDFMVINIEKSGRPQSPQFSHADTLICKENGFQ